LLATQYHASDGRPAARAVSFHPQTYFGVSTGKQKEDIMDRRTLLKAAAGVGTLALSQKLAAPALAQGAAARTLRFVPQADLANFDPIWGTQYVVRNASALVWDTLYGVDENLEPRRQMVESEEVSADGLTWTFKLRPGPRFP
jgi:peptide/nickel transport system substrate-binding protein